MKDIDLFDKNNRDDLPKEVTDVLRKRERGMFGMTERVLELFSYKEKLDIDELAIGLYRKFKIIRSRNAITGYLHELIKAGKISRIGYGAYKIEYK